MESFSTHIADELDFRVILPLHQAHGVKCSFITSATPPSELTGVDALVTQEPGLRIGVKTADCVPVLLYDPHTGTIAAIHSGWKGTVANIIRHTISGITTRLGVEAEDMRAVIGPCIHLEAFEVGDDVFDKFSNAGYRRFCRRLPRFGGKEDEKWHIDLPSICLSQLMDCGVNAVEVRPECTYTQHDIFYSARRLGSGFGRQRILNCIMLI